jgi:hypothetical protein
MHVPAMYVPLIQSSTGYTIKQAWDILYPSLTRRQEVDICRPLIQWLQMPSTGTGLVNPLEAGVPAEALVISLLALDNKLIAHHHCLVWSLHHKA